MLLHWTIVMVIVVITYHAVYWSYRASRTGRWFLPCWIPWVPGLPKVAHSLTEDRECRPTRIWGQWQLQSISISNGDERWPVEAPGVKGQGKAEHQYSSKQGQVLGGQHCNKQATIAPSFGTRQKRVMSTGQ